jgi:hypothetical protein
VKELFVINFYYEEGEEGPFKPVVRDIRFDAVHCKSAERVMNLRGFRDDPIRDIRLVDVTVDSAAEPSRIENVEDLHFERVSVNGKAVSGVADLLPENAR